MRWKMLLVCGAGLLVAAAGPETGANQGELEKFTGTWQAVAIERDGKPVPKDEVTTVKLVVKGERYTFHLGEQKIQGTHTLDPAKTPKQIDAVGTDGPGAGETLKGIYELTADTFKVCFADAGKDRPTAFRTTGGGGHRLLELKRQRP